MYDYDKLVIQVQRVSENHKFVISGVAFKKKKEKNEYKYTLKPVKSKIYGSLFGEKNAIKTAKTIANDEHDALLYKEIVAVIYNDNSGIGDVIWREE